MKTEFREENQNYVMTFEGRLDTPSSLQVERDMQVLYACHKRDCPFCEIQKSCELKAFVFAITEAWRPHRL